MLKKIFVYAFLFQFSLLFSFDEKKHNPSSLNDDYLSYKFNFDNTADTSSDEEDNKDRKPLRSLSLGTIKTTFSKAFKPIITDLDRETILTQLIAEKTKQYETDIDYNAIVQISAITYGLNQKNLQEIIESAEKSANNKKLTAESLFLAAHLYTKNFSNASDKIKILLCKHFFQQDKLELNQKFLEYFLERYNCVSAENFKNISKRASNISFLKKQSSNLSVLEDAASSYLNADQEVAQVPKEYILKSYKNRFQLKVKSQNDIDGGGRASCAYHALKNGIVIAKALTANYFNSKDEILKDLESKEMVENLFGKETSKWRSLIVGMRKKNVFVDFVHSVLRSVIIETDKHYSSLLTISSQSNLMQVILEKKGIVSDNLREIARDVIESNSSFLNNTDTFRIRYSELKPVILKVLSKKMEITEQHINLYFHNINNLIVEVSPTQLRSCFIEESSKNKKISFQESDFLLQSSSKPEGIAQEWLNQDEIYRLVEVEQDNVLKNLKGVNFICFGDVAFRNLEKINILSMFEEYELNDKFKQLVDKFRDTSQKFIAVLPIYFDNHFITMVVNKNKRHVQYYLADSFSNQCCIFNPGVAQIISFLENENLEEDFISYLKLKKSKEKPVSKDNQKKDNFIIEAPEKIKFDLTKDYIGNLPTELLSIIDYLKDTKKYTKEGLKPFNTLLLYGPPGTGKTSLAKGIAKATNRHLLNCSAAVFITKWQGSGSQSVKSIFESAYQLNKPTIIFIDEIDTVTADRSKESNKEYQNTLMTITNSIDQLLEKDKSVQVFVIVATNHFDSIDSALKSRFSGKCIEIPIPTIDDRRIIFANLLNNKIPSNSNLPAQLSQMTDKFSVRDLVNSVNAALMEKIRLNSNQLDTTHFAAFFKPISDQIGKEQAKQEKEQKTEQRQRIREQFEDEQIAEFERRRTLENIETLKAVGSFFFGKGK